MFLVSLTSVDGKYQRYLEGMSNILGIVDPNRNIKKSRYQIIGGSCDTVMGQDVLNPYILKLTGVYQ